MRLLWNKSSTGIFYKANHDFRHRVLFLFLIRRKKIDTYENSAPPGGATKIDPFLWGTPQTFFWACDFRHTPFGAVCPDSGKKKQARAFPENLQNVPTFCLEQRYTWCVPETTKFRKMLETLAKRALHLFALNNNNFWNTPETSSYTNSKLFCFKGCVRGRMSEKNALTRTWTRWGTKTAVHPRLFQKRYVSSSGNFQISAYL